MSLELIIGVGMVGFLLLYMAKDLGTEHFAFRLISYCLVAIMFLLVAKAGIDADTSCEQLINTTWENQTSNVTFNTYGTYCYEQTTSTSTAFHSLMTAFIVVFFGYVIFFFAYKLFKMAEDLIKRK